MEKIETATLLGFIVVWYYERGFGFIRNEATRERFYAHIKSFVPKESPNVGDRVEFTVKSRREGKYRSVESAMIVDGGR